jgi:hypothetical protein
MCTLTFAPNEQGYLLGMNRDERIARDPASPPARLECAGVAAIYPRDIEGGTWIGVNQLGVAFALLNWNDVGVVHPKVRSRGCVIPSLISAASTRTAATILNRLEPDGLLPFRLIGFFPAERQVIEWRWNQKRLEQEAFIWDSRQWYSSSLSDAQAGIRRGVAHARAQNESDRGSVTWLWRLHASHDPEHRPFSICVHREEVKTVSYTELICTSDQVECRYHSGSPCLPERELRSIAVRRIAAESRPISH